MEFNGHCMIEVKYRREKGVWKLVEEHIDARIRNRNPQLMARMTVIDLRIACAKRRKLSPEENERRQEAIPRKHASLLVEAVRMLGLFPKSIHEKSSGEIGRDGETYIASVIVEDLSPPYIHLG